MTLSMAVFFTIVIIGIQGPFPTAIHDSLINLGGVQLAPLAAVMSPFPRRARCSPRFLGYNPMDAILSAMLVMVVNTIPHNISDAMEGQKLFRNRWLMPSCLRYGSRSSSAPFCPA